MEAWSILVVDDQPTYRAVLSMLVEADPRFAMFGVATDGQQAVDLAAQRCPDAVILDMRMPVMDGLTALPLLRQSCPDSIIAVYSSDPDVAAEAPGLGANLVYDKAHAPADLLDQLAQLCGA